MCEVNLLTGAGCHCGASLYFEASDEKLTGISGQYTTHEGKTTFYAKVNCRQCGVVFDPDHKKFAAYFNEAADRLKEDSS